jgi:hypothetical protein
MFKGMGEQNMIEWISCKEKMPEKDGRYLVVEVFINHHWVGVSSLRGGKWDCVKTEWWAELPTAPEEVK